MSWQIIINKEHPIVELHIRYAVAATELPVIAQATLTATESFPNCLILADCTQLTGGHSVFDLYALANGFLEYSITHKLKEAVLLPESPDFVNTVKFWETVCINRGINVQIFDDREEAIAWLLQ